MIMPCIYILLLLTAVPEPASLLLALIAQFCLLVLQQLLVTSPLLMVYPRKRRAAGRKKHWTICVSCLVEVQEVNTKTCNCNTLTFCAAGIIGCYHKLSFHDKQLYEMNAMLLQTGNSFLNYKIVQTQWFQYVCIVPQFLVGKKNNMGMSTIFVNRYSPAIINYFLEQILKELLFFP